MLTWKEREELRDSRIAACKVFSYSLVGGNFFVELVVRRKGGISLLLLFRTIALFV